jgi:hypothetical protein
MKSKGFPILMFCLVSAMVFGQSDVSVWNSVTKVQDNNFMATFPDGWKKVTQAEGSQADYKYELTGVGIPAIARENSPLYGFFTISHLQGNKFGKAQEQIVTEFTNFNDRLTEINYNYDSASAIVKSGQTGKLLHTRYYRRTKVSNYSNYYLIVYSPKADQTYVLALHFQYKDTSYDIERTAKMKEYALAVFSRFEFR